KAGIPVAIAGADETEAERVQRVAHPARIGVFELPSGKLLARVTATAEGELRDVGTSRAPGGAESVAARARQANSCGLALEFREIALSASKSAQAPEESAGSAAPETAP